MDIKPDIMIPKHLAYMIPDDITIMMNMYEVDTGAQRQLTETYMEGFMIWVQKNHPEYLKKFGAVKL